MKAYVPVFQTLLDASYIPAEGKHKLQAFLQQAQGESDMDDLSLHAPQGSVSNYDSQSGGIMSTLTDMQEKAEGQVSDLRKAEMEAQFSFQMVEQSLNDEMKAISDKTSAATTSKAASGEALGKANGELAVTKNTKAADEARLAATTEECATKKQEWAMRQKSAAEEQGAIAKAKEILEGGVKVLAQVKTVTQRRGAQDESDDASQERR